MSDFLNIYKKVKDGNPEAGSQRYSIFSAVSSFKECSYKKSVKKNIRDIKTIINVFESQVIDGKVELTVFTLDTAFLNMNCSIEIKVHSNYFGEFFYFELSSQTNEARMGFWTDYSEEKEKLLRKGSFKITFSDQKKTGKSKQLILEKINSIAYERFITPNYLENNFMFFLTYIYMYTHDKKYQNVVSRFVGNNYKLYLQMEWVENMNLQLNNYIDQIFYYTQKRKEFSDSLLRLKEVKKNHDLLEESEQVFSPIMMSHINNAIEMLEYILKNPDEDCFQKLFSHEWVSNFEIMEWSEAYIKSDKKSEKDFWSVTKDLPPFNSEANLANLSPENTNYGLCVSGYDMSFEKKSIELIPSTGYKDLSKFWKTWFPVSPFTIPEYFKGDDIHVNYEKLNLFISLFENKSSLSDNDLKDLIFSISKEIEDDQQYVLHPDATFDMQNEIFPLVKINKDSLNAYEYYAKFITDANEFFTICFNLNYGTASIVSAIGQDPSSSGKNELALYCIQLLRDFLVPENREVIFGERKRKGRAIKTLYDKSLNVIYIPRIKYKYIDNKNFKSTYENNFPYRPKQKHKVSHHLRQLTENQKPSIESILLARKYNCSVPDGYTFVKAHERGGFNEEQKRVYRSRSMLLSAYEGKETRVSKVKWFKFEKDVAKLFESRLKKVIVRAPSNDGGVDVEGVDNDGNTVFIQCKCYSHGKKVDRAIIDELIGVIARFKTKHETPNVKGIVATTSSFSQSAVVAANEGNIELLSGNDLEKMGL